MKLKALIAATKANQEPLIVTDFPRGYHLPPNQLTFSVSDGHDEWRTTYCFGHGEVPRPVLQLYFSLRHTYPGLLAELVFALYGQRIKFEGSTKGAIAFLHDHIALCRVLRDITFRYRLKDIVANYQNLPKVVFIPKTIVRDFRRFSNIPVHKLSELMHTTWSLTQTFGM